LKYDIVYLSPIVKPPKKTIMLLGQHNIVWGPKFQDLDTRK